MADIKKDPFEEYIKNLPPSRKEIGQAWSAAIGLQDVDGLKTSEYLYTTAKKNIDGEITIDEAGELINSYYESRLGRTEHGTEEADKVSQRIAKLLSDNAFVFSPAQYISIHKELFKGIYSHAGEIRDYNITKKEWILNSETVLYAPFETIKEALDYDFSIEKDFQYEGLDIEKSIKHIAKFTSLIWQIHPFCEGNTRTIAVFIIKYLRKFGFNVNNDEFANNSWYFRNALVRANYNDLKKDISATSLFLERFFENLLLNRKNLLKNRYLHVDYDKNFKVQKMKFQSAIFAL